MKNNTWIKVVITIVILELVVGGAIFAYKKLNVKDSNNISVKDKKVVNLYNKIAYFDIDSLDVMNPESMLYYGYKNIKNKESINCDVVEVSDNTEGYECEGIVDFVKSDTIENKVKDIYGPNIIIEKTSFEVDPNHYAFYDSINDGFVLYTKKEEEKVNPVNLKLKQATYDDKKNILLTVDVLDGVFGDVLNTYKFTFEKASKNYYLIKKEKVTS